MSSVGKTTHQVFIFCSTILWGLYTSLGVQSAAKVSTQLIPLQSCSVSPVTRNRGFAVVRVKLLQLLRPAVPLLCGESF